MCRSTWRRSIATWTRIAISCPVSGAAATGQLPQGSDQGPVGGTVTPPVAQVTFLPNGRGRQFFQNAVEHGGDGEERGVLKLTEERGRLIVLQTGLPFLV